MLPLQTTKAAIVTHSKLDLPLGTVSGATVEAALGILARLNALIAEREVSASSMAVTEAKQVLAEITAASNSFYKLVPISGANGAVTLIDTKKAVTELVDGLHAVVQQNVCARLLLAASVADGRHPFEYIYRGMGAALVDVQKESDTYRLISEYFDTTGPNPLEPDSQQLEIASIFSVRCAADDAQFHAKVSSIYTGIFARWMPVLVACCLHSLPSLRLPSLRLPSSRR